MRRIISLALAVSLFGVYLPGPARAENINTPVAIGILVTVLGIFTWVGWKTEKEDRASGFSDGGRLPASRREGPILAVTAYPRTHGSEGADWDPAVALAWSL